jgi:hypothetical protein
VRSRFRAFPAAGGGQLTPRPIVDIALEGLEAAPVACLLDTGALRTRMSAELAELAGIDLTANPVSEPVAVGGVHTVCRLARVTLAVATEGEEHSWDASVWFCDPWPFAFGLAGLEGFLYHFRVTISAYHEYLDLLPEEM